MVLLRTTAASEHGPKGSCLARLALRCGAECLDHCLLRAGEVTFRAVGVIYRNAASRMSSKCFSSS